MKQFLSDTLFRLEAVKKIALGDRRQKPSDKTK
jgi:hypothetical protein